jgi:hypothetical protein
MSNSNVRVKKFFINVIDERFPDNAQFNILTLLNSDSGGDLLINQYAKVFTLKDLGEFDVIKDGEFGVLLFFPIDNRINDYTYSFVSSQLLQENNSIVDSFFLGDLIEVGSYKTTTNNFSKIIGISSNYSSTKLNIQLTVGDNYQFDEINFTHSENDLIFANYGTIFSGSLSMENSTGLGTYYAYKENNSIFVDFIPNVNILDTSTFNTSIISIANTNFSTPGKQDLSNVTIESKKTIIPATSNPIAVGVGSHGFVYQSSYYIAQCTDLTNNRIQLSEIVVINSRTQSYSIEFASLSSGGTIGTFSALKTLDTELLFTPDKDIDVEVVIYQNKISSIIEVPDSSNIFDLNNFQFISGLSRAGDGDAITDFNLTHKGTPIFERFFNGSNASIVDLNNNTILLPNHFFVTGQKVKYISDELDENSSINSIGITETNIAGIGLTDKLPNEVFVVKVDSIKIKLAKSAENALKILPETLSFNSLGIENLHKIVSKNQNVKTLISIDNIIQSPIISMGQTTILSENVTLDDLGIKVGDEKIFSTGNLIKVGDEIMKVLSVGIGSTNSIITRRNFLGTTRGEHLSGSLVKKLQGNYNIINNKLYFSSAPYGLSPDPKITDLIDEIDYTGIQTSSSFDGRVFLRSGIPLNDKDTYNTNYLFDDISNNFNGITTQFALKSNQQNITGISTDNAVVLINNIYQSPKGTILSNVPGSYYLEEELGETKIIFVGAGISNPSDINTSQIPFGGVISSVGSTSGFGYQPLVSAGGTAIVSIAGTISNISIGNSGSGYRVGIQTQIKVGVQTYSSGVPNIEIIGIASIMNGNVVGVSITNPGFGYSYTNPPEVIFDSPIGYINIPLIYSNSSQIGIGTQATIDLVVGQGNNIIDFNLNNYGYGYNKGDVLTVPLSGIIGIPTISNTLLNEFKIFVDEVFNPKFSGWSMGQFEVLDNLDTKFNARNKNFQLSLEGKPISISKKKGSPIELEYVLLVFINDVLQIPFKNYTFTGSVLKLKEAPRGRIDNPTYFGDTSKILFYKGTADIDVEFVDILDSPKVGDTLTIKSDVKKLSQKSRIIELISAIDTADTNKYSDIGVSSDENLLRPVTWCKQNNDLYISGKSITKDRKIYEPKVNPVSNIIKNISSSDTEIFVETVKLFFDYSKENISLKSRDIIEIISNTEDTVGIRSTYYEKITNISKFEGDFGNIVGISSTSIVGVSNTCIVFDLFVPIDSYLRNGDLNAGISTQGISGIETGHRFVVSGTSIGNPNISFDVDKNLVSVGSLFLNNIYECIDFYNDEINVVGVGVTNVTKVVVSVDSYGGIVGFGSDKIYGRYSWGKITAPFRSSPIDFNIDIPEISEISSYPIVRRKNPLRFDTYLP